MKKLLISGLLSCSLLFSGIIGEHKTEAATQNVGVKAANIALNFIGVPYRWGGTTPSGFDCSGFVGFSYKQAGFSLPRTAAQQFTQGIPVSKSQLKEGDLVFFSTYTSGASHVGIYLNNNRFIHASSSGVRIDTLSGKYWVHTYYGTKRIDSTGQNGWVLSGNTWYYYSEGVKQTGWILDGGKWYYLKSNGVMATGWIYTGGKWYYLYKDGSMAANTKVDGYKVGSDGAWIR